MILDIKTPPPPYISTSPRSSSPSTTLSTLPPHLLLHIIYLTFPQSSLPDLPKLVRQRKTLYWLSISLRLVDRTLYAACMHVLRSTLIPAYYRLVRKPYTSDPFPLLAPQTTRTDFLNANANSSQYASIPPTNQPESPLSTIQRETAILDKFIALKVREDVWADASELHLERGEAYKDLFDYAQPRARLEDLVRVYGVQSGVVCVGSCVEEGSIVSEAEALPANVPSQLQQEPDTESKPRLFPPGPTYYNPVPPPPPSSCSPTTSTSSIATYKPSPALTKPTNSFLFFFSLKSKPKPKSSSLSSSSFLSPSPSVIDPPSTICTPKPRPIPMSNLTIALNPRSAGLVLANNISRRTIVSTHRTRGEPLESVASRLVGQLCGLGWE